jgi:GDP-L-fucose synthase
MKLDDSIFVAGHTGLLGSAFLRRFESFGFKNIKTSSHQDLDLENPSAVNHFFKLNKPRYVFMAAGAVGGILENIKYPADLISRNLSIQLNIFRAAHQFKVEKVIFFVSSCVYPKNAKQPMHENLIFSGYLEDSSQSYAISKLAGLQLGKAFNQQYNYKKYISLLPNSMFGPNDNFIPDSGHVLSALIARFYDAKMRNLNSVTLWGSGKPRREFVYVDDVVDATLFIMNLDNLNSLTEDFPINIGVGKDYSISELAQIVARIVGYKGKINFDCNKPDGAPRKMLDTTNLAKLGWKSTRNFEDDLTQTYQWFVKHIKSE